MSDATGNWTAPPRKSTLWGRARRSARAWSGEARRRVRERWLRADPPGRAREFRRSVEDGYRRQDLVRRVVADLGLPLDLDLVRYRRLRRVLVWDEVRLARREMLAGLICMVVMSTVWYLAARHYQVPSAVMGLAFGALGLVVLLPPILVTQWLLERLPRTGLVVFLLFNVAMEAAAGLVVYGEIVGKGPVHAMVGRVPEHFWLYLGVHAVLTYAVLLTAVFVLAPIIVLAERRRRLRRSATATAVDAIFRCVELAHDDTEFLRPDTRRQLVTHTHEVARVLRHGLWRSMWVRSPLVFAQLKKRCAHAGQSVEVLCADLVLPERTTREHYLEKVLRLADTLLSGRLGELPDEPERTAYPVRGKVAFVRRLAAGIAVSFAPLAAYLLLRHFHLIPASAEVPVLTLCIAWLATFGLNAISRRDPEVSSQFPNVLGIFGSTK